MKKLLCAIIASLMCMLTIHLDISANNSSVISESIDEFSMLNEFAIPDLTENELQHLCDIVNGIVEPQSDDTFCLTSATMLIDYYYNKRSLQREAIPTYLHNAYESIQNKSTLTSTYNTTNEYVISLGGKFRVFYNNADPYEILSSVAYLTGVIFDAIDAYYCETDSFPRPLGETNYYDIHIIPGATLEASGTTTPCGDGKSYISISQGLLEKFYEDENDTFVLGVAAHEYMHAILMAADIPYLGLDYQTLHESLARAIGIEYDANYANEGGICGDIRSFTSQLSYSLGSMSTSNFINGSALFYLYIYDEYGGWNTISYMINNFSSNSSVLYNLNEALYEENNDTIDLAYEKFLVYAVNPDRFISLSPTNRFQELNTAVNSWGYPNPTWYINVTENNETLSSPTAYSLPYLACNYIKITSYNNTSKYVTVTVTYTIPNNSEAIPRGAYVFHNNSLDFYNMQIDVVSDNQFSCSFGMSISGIDYAYIAIANGGLSGDLMYSYSVNIASN